MFTDEMAARLEAMGVGTRGKDIFVSSQAKIPAGDGPYLTLTETGGVAPGGFRGGGGRIHNEAGVHVQSPGAQIAVRASTYEAARAMARAAYLALDGIWNTTLSGVFYQKVTARQEPTDVGLDSTGRVVVVFNIDAQKQPS